MDKEELLTFDLYHVKINGNQTLLNPTGISSRYDMDFQIQVIIPETSDTLIIEYNREKDIFISSDPRTRVNIKEKK